MADASPIAQSMAGAAQSLRDTAKWLVGGVAATAAGVFAGSSLTSLGSLEWSKDHLRLFLALVGASAGFFGLAAITRAAVGVLNRRSLTMREIALADEAELVTLRMTIEARYKGRFPKGIETLKAYVDCVDAARRRGAITPLDQALLADARADNDVMSADGTFLLVKARFDRLVDSLGWATPVAAVGFGLFAWAANPPPQLPPKADPPALSLTIAGPSNW